MNVAGKTCRNDAACFVLGEQLSQHHTNRLFRWRRAALFGIGAVQHEQSNAVAGCKRTEACQVCATIVHWREVNLEVARVDDDTLWGVQGNCMCIRHRVRYGNELNVKWPDATTLIVFDGDHFGFAKQPCFFNAVTCKTKRYLRAVNRK